MVKNGTTSGVWDAASDSDTFNYIQHLKSDILPNHQPQLEVADTFFAH